MDRVALLIELMGDEKAKSSLKNLKSQIDSLNKDKININFQKTQLDREINSVRQNLNTLTSARRTLKLEGKDVTAVDKQIAVLRDRLNELTGQKRELDIEARVDTQALGILNSELSEAERRAYSLGDVFRGIGSGIQSLGGAVSSMGGALQSLGNTFGGNILDKITTTLTAYGTILATQGLGRSIERYDTFRTFPRLMEQIGYSTEDANKAINAMNDAVLGLPTSLNEIVESSKNYIQLTGDIEKGTALAIASNNAFLANASDASQVYQGMKQINDILSKGELRSTEWMSLFASLGTSLQPIAEYMGFASDEIGDFRQQLSEGAIDAREFIDALIAVGTGEGALVERANIQKDTLSATIANVKNAFSILGGAVLEELNTMFEEYTGEGLPANVKRISDALKTNLIPAVREWLQENGETIVGLFEKLGEFDWMGMIGKIVSNVERLFEIVGKVFNFLDEKLPDGWLTDFIAFSTVMASPLGKTLSLLGTFITGIGGIFVKLGGLKLPNFGLLRKGTEGLSALVGGFKTIAQSFLSATALIAVIAEIGLVIAEFAKIAEYIGSIDLGNFDRNIEPILKFAGLASAIGVAVVGIMTAISQSGIGGLTVLAGEGLTAGLVGIVAMIGGVIAEFADLSERIGAMDINWETFDRNAEKLAGGMASLEIMVAGLGGLAGLTLPAQLLGNWSARNLSETVEEVSKALKAVADTEVPTRQQIQRVADAFEALQELTEVESVEEFAYIFTSGIFGIDKKQADAVEEAVRGIQAIADSLDAFRQIDDAKFNTATIKQKIGQVTQALTTVHEVLEEAFSTETGYVASSAEVQTKSESKAIENMQSALTTLSTTVDTLTEIKGKIGELAIRLDDGEIVENSSFDKLRDNIVAVVTALDSVHEAIVTGFEGGLLSSRIATSQEDNIISNMNDAVSEITTTIGILKGIQNVFSEWELDDSTTKELNRIVDAIQSISENMSESTYTITSELVQIAGYYTDIATEAQNLQTAIQGLGIGEFEYNTEPINKMIEAIQGISETILGDGLFATIRAQLEAWQSEDIATTIRQYVGIVESLKDLADEFRNMDFAFDGIGDVTGLKEKIEPMLMLLSGIANNADLKMADDVDRLLTNLIYMQHGLERLSEIVEQINGMVETLDAVNGTDYGVQIATVIGNLVGAFNAIPEDVEDIVERVENLNTAIETVQTVVDQITAMQENLQGAVEGDAVGNIGTIFQQLASALSTGEEDEGWQTNLEVMQVAIDSLNSALVALGEVSLETLIEQLSTCAEKIENLTSLLESLSTALIQVVADANSANIAVSEMGNSADSAQTGVSNLTSALGLLSFELSYATSQANSLANAINNIPTSKTVTVNYSETSGVVRSYFSEGGIAGETTFVPKGTDTIPAMLTRGEGIVNTKAMQLVGNSFIERLNSLDLGGAFRSLFGRTSLPSDFTFVNNDQRQYHDRHDVHNTNVYTNNTGYADHFIGRALGAI